MAELGSGSGSSYPGAIDTDTTQEVNSPNAGRTKARAEVINDAYAAIVALQTELGTNPAGSLADVVTWLQTEHGADGTHDATKIVEIAGAQTITGVKTFSAIVKTAKGADVASTNALTLLTDGNAFDITGTTAITSIGTQGIGTIVVLQFDGILTFTHHATNLILPSGANIITAAGDIAVMYEYATGDWRCIAYTRADGKSVVSTISQSDLADYAAGTVLQHNNAAEVSGSTGGSVYFKSKETIVPRNGTMTVKFDGKFTSGGASSKVKIYRNGIAVGTERTMTASYATWSENIAGWTIGDTLEAWYSLTTGSVEIKNLNIYSDVATEPASVT